MIEFRIENEEFRIVESALRFFLKKIGTTKIRKTRRIFRQDYRIWVVCDRKKVKVKGNPKRYRTPANFDFITIYALLGII